MCPMCVSTLMMAALGTVSAGGVTAAVVKRLKSKRVRRDLEALKSPPNQGEQS